MWLELEHQGYMATGLAMYCKATIRAAFEEKLAEYSAVQA